MFAYYSTGEFMKKVHTTTCALRDRKIVSIERVYTSSMYLLYEISCISINDIYDMYMYNVYQYE